MIDKLLEHKKAALEYMSRNKPGRLTRSMKQVWNRGLKFNGTLTEWKEWREEAEKQKSEKGRNGQDPHATLSGAATTADSTGSAVDDPWGDIPIVEASEAKPMEDVWGSDHSASNAFTNGTGGVDRDDDPWGGLAPPLSKQNGLSASDTSPSFVSKPNETAAESNPCGNQPVASDLHRCVRPDYKRCLGNTNCGSLAYCSPMGRY